MGSRSDIEWTEATWNPLTGCTKISPGCKHCYAETMARRLQAMGQPNYRNGFQLTLHEHVLEVPVRWRRPRVIFVNSMSDLFHEEVPLGFIQSVFATMVRADWHCYQVLTKRATRLAEVAPLLSWPRHVWMGVSVERNDYLDRVDHLRVTPAAVKFLSLEPLLGPLPDLSLEAVDWVIVGGESGPGARAMDSDWVRPIRDQCVERGIAFFLKQLGGWPDKRHGGDALLDGRRWQQMPASMAQS